MTNQSDTCDKCGKKDKVGAYSGLHKEGVCDDCRLYINNYTRVFDKTMKDNHKMFKELLNNIKKDSI